MKEAYEQKMEAQIKEWKAKIEQLKAKADQAKADTKIEYHRQVEALRVKLENVQSRLSALKSASGQAWDDLKGGFEGAWDELKKAFADAAGKFKPPGG